MVNWEGQTCIGCGHIITMMEGMWLREDRMFRDPELADFCDDTDDYNHHPIGE